MTLLLRISGTKKGFYFEDYNTISFYGIYYSYDNKYKDYWINDKPIGYSIENYTDKEFYI